MEKKDIHRLQLGLIIFSFLFLLTGTRLLYNSWTSIHIYFWLIFGISSIGLYRIYKTITNRNIHKLFIGFDIIHTVTIVGVISLMTIMYFIFYPVLALLFFGLFLATLGIASGLKFITFDMDNNKIKGLPDQADIDIDIEKITIEIDQNSNQIEIKTVDKNGIIILKKENYSGRVWSELIDNFHKIQIRT